MKKRMKKIDFIIHNMNNILFSISGLILTGHKKEAQLKMQQTFGAFQHINENLRPIEYLINAKIHLINKYKIKLFIDKDISFPNIDEADLCLIFGNILDNAIESCIRFERDNKFISLIFSKNDKEYTYEISNSRFFSNKKDKNKNHLGLKTIGKIVHKNHGDFKICQSNKDVFKLKIKLFDS